LGRKIWDLAVRIKTKDNAGPETCRASRIFAGAGLAGKIVKAWTDFGTGTEEVDDACGF
jgi:hypothetical protein